MKNTRGYRITLIMSFILSSIALICLIFLDKLYLHRGILTEGYPNFSFDYLIRSAAIFISLSVVYWSLIGRKRPQLVLVESEKMLIERLSILGTLFLSTIFLLFFLLLPSVFSILSLEDGPIEWGSAILLLSSCIIFLVVFLRCRNYLYIPKITQWTLVFFALVFFLIAMEEISWFQRAIEIETPTLLKGNKQNELNLHNFATNKIENIYYFGAFLFLVVLPFLRILFPFIVNSNYLKLFVPLPFISIIGAVSCAYNFDMWNIIFIQISFFSAVIILFAFTIFCSSRNEKNITVFTIFLLVVTQAIFLTNGDNFLRIWEVTEYKEFFIPLAFFIYSLSIYCNVNQVYLSKGS